ncbi:MAG TPA: peptidase, partial [Microscillaceae bacterium]|nr:peptidase [Microscillaceae bacterium]
RHTDYFNRSISCGSGGNEGSAGVGAIHIPGTPTTNVNANTSVMNACFNSGSTGVFTSSDNTALNFLY